MEWQKTRFPGCEVKVLLLDRETGLMTSLFKFAPGATLPDHEHVGIEQTYMLDGHLVDKEGPAKGIEARKGEFIWREPGSRHSAWSPNGGMTRRHHAGAQQVLRRRRPRDRRASAGRGTRTVAADRGRLGSNGGNAMDAAHRRPIDKHSHLVQAGRDGMAEDALPRLRGRRR